MSDFPPPRTKEQNAQLALCAKLGLTIEVLLTDSQASQEGYDQGGWYDVEMTYEPDKGWAGFFEQFSDTHYRVKR